ncbi:tumor necrosis factor receptor superfamily member 5-like [Mustelus asterias]
MRVTCFLLFLGAVHCHSSCSKQQYQGNHQCCHMCPAGSYVRRECNVSAESQCAPCGQGEYMDDWNGLLNCLKCSSCDQDYGFKELQACTPSRARKCGCRDGFYCEKRNEDGECTTCKRLICKIGEGPVRTDSGNNRTECKPCQQGFFSDSASESPCGPWTQCEDLGLETLRAGSAASDTECGIRTDSPLLSIALGLGVTVIVSFTLLLTYTCIRKHRGSSANIEEKKEPKPPLMSKDYRVREKEYLNSEGKKIMDLV